MGRLKTINLTVAQAKYKVEWFYEYGNDTKDKNTETRIQISDTITITQLIHRAQDNGWEMSNGGVYFWDNTGGTAGSKTFDLDMQVEGGNGNVQKFRVILTEVIE